MSTNQSLDASRLTFEAALASEWFTWGFEGGNIELHDVDVLVLHDSFEEMDLLVRTAEDALRSKRALLVVAPDISDIILETLVVNHTRDTLEIAVVLPKGCGTRKSGLIDDLAVVACNGNAGVLPFDDEFPKPAVGHARRVQISSGRTTLIGGAGSRAHVEQRLEELISRREANLGPGPEREPQRFIMHEALTDRIALMTEYLSPFGS